MLRETTVEAQCFVEAVLTDPGSDVSLLMKQVSGAHLPAQLEKKEQPVLLLFHYRSWRETDPGWDQYFLEWALPGAAILERLHQNLVSMSTKYSNCYLPGGAPN